MSGPQRKADQTAISISMSRELLDQIDRRAQNLGLTRSQYLAHLARQDCVEGGDLVLRETPVNYRIRKKLTPPEDERKPKT